MKLPQDLANLLAVAIRDVIWYHGKVDSFLASCGVPKAVMIEVGKLRSEKTPTIKVVHYVLDELDRKGDEGWSAARKMLTDMHYWKDIHSVKADRKDKALASLKELQRAYQQYRSQQEYQDQQQRHEQKMHQQRQNRVTLSRLDHAKLQEFRDEFDKIWIMKNHNQRGDRFEDLMNRIFAYFSDDSKGSFRRVGEQIDGQFYFDKHWYFVEVRWREKKASAQDVSVLRDRAKAAYGGDAKGLFISFNGFSPECLESLKGRSDERVILMDGVDLRDVLNCDLAFDVLLAEKQADIVRNKRPFISARDILKEKAE